MLTNYSVYVVQKRGNFSQLTSDLCVTNQKDKAMMKALGAIAKDYPLIQNGNYSVDVIEYNIIPLTTNELLNSLFIDHAEIEHNALCDLQAAERENRIQNRYVKFTSDDLKKYYRR